MLREVRSDPLVRLLGHTTVVLVLLTLGYYLLPLRFDRGAAWTAARLVISLLALGLLAVLFRRRQRKSREVLSTRYLRIEWLLSALYVLVLTFALVYAALAVFRTGEFVGIEDRTDALYFSVTIVATVGFGDIHAQGTAAKLLVTVHMLFNLIYLGTALRLLTGSQAAAAPTPGEE